MEAQSFPVVGCLLRGWRRRRYADRVMPGLSVGSGRAALALREGEFDRVFSVASGFTVSCTTDDYALVVDAGPDDRQQRAEFSDAVDELRDVILTEEKVFVHCYEGRERAPTVTATALAAARDIAFGQALDELRAHRPCVEPTPELTDLANWYLGQTEEGCDR